LPGFSTSELRRENRSRPADVETFRAVEDDVDVATPVAAQNAPTGVWKSRKEREIPTASTSIIISFFEEERRTKRLKPTVHQIGSSAERLSAVIALFR
jgi:hypothetical protein